MRIARNLTVHLALVFCLALATCRPVPEQKSEKDADPGSYAAIGGVVVPAETHTLNLNNYGLKNLNGIENVRYVEKLGLSGNPITDITGIVHLKSLTSLDLSDTLVKNFGPLKALPNLRKLYLMNVRLDNVDALPAQLEVLVVTRVFVEPKALSRYKAQNPRCEIVVWENGKPVRY